ncbi:MAG: hypothetical protein V1936_00915 [Patescibacteria group bacterium]
MNFQRQPIYTKSGKRLKELSGGPNRGRPEAVKLGVTDLLSQQMRLVYRQLLKIDPALVVKFPDSQDDRFKVVISGGLAYHLDQVRSLQLLSQQAGLFEGDDLEHRAKKLSKLRKTVRQWVKLLEDVLNGDREPPKRKSITESHNSRRSFNTAPKTLLRSKRHEGGSYSRWRRRVSQPKKHPGAPYSRV